MMPVIEQTYAWQVIRDARHHVFDGAWRVDNRLTIEPDGSWAAADISAQAARLFDTLLPIACGGPARVIAQLGQSLDGRIATTSGHSHYVTGEASRVHLHRLRALVDAVIVGVGTATADDPQLTVRHVDGKDPVRVVLDPGARAPATLRLFTDHGPPTLHMVAPGARAAPGATSVCVEVDSAARVAPAAVLAALAERGLHRVLVEGGGVTISRFMQADAVDRLHSVVAPLLIGSGRPALTLAEIDTLDQARRPACCCYPMGEDQLFDLDLRAGRR